MTKNKRTSLLIQNIKDIGGKSHFISEAITKQFLDFCTPLYHLSSDPLSNTKNRLDAICLFLDQFSLKPFDPAAAVSLYSPLPKEEFRMALGDMKPGKSPGPDGFTIQYFRSFMEILSSHVLVAFGGLRLYDRIS